jgi:hypothetical protein
MGTLAVALVAAPAGADPGPGGAADERVLSLLAVGDTGESRALGWLREGQRAVAAGLAAEHARAPVDALVLLGDLFYPDGLRSEELVRRVRDNLVAPYCAFVSLAGPRSREVASACARTGSEPPVRIFAVLGNHDYDTPGSPDLERRAVPAFVSNWRMPEGVAEVAELPGGVSLVLADAPALVAGADPEALRDALRRARGPWRILALHVPVAPGERAREEWGGLSPWQAFAVPDARVHLALAGHRHDLRVVEGRPPGPALHVIAGSGSSVHARQWAYQGERFALGRTGFARVDLVRRGGEERLVASLYATPRYPVVFWKRPELVARWSVGASGGVRDELAGGGDPKSSASASSSATTR